MTEDRTAGRPSADLDFRAEANPADPAALVEDRTAGRPSGDLDFRAEANPADPAALVEDRETALAALAAPAGAAPAGAATAVDLPVKLLARYRHTPAALPRSERAPEK